MGTTIRSGLLWGAIGIAPLSGLLGCNPSDVQAGDGGVNQGDGGVSGAKPEADPKLQGITALHNTARAGVNPQPATPLPPLTWDTKVAAAAQAVADSCSFQHSGNGYGENIYAAAGSAPTPTDVVNSWTSEKANYTYSSNTCGANKTCGHYTQVVWRDSLRLGCGQKTCTTGSPFIGFPTWQFWVCDYDPPGNFGGQRPY